MSLPDPTINFRAPQQVKDALHLLASRRGEQPGPLVRDFLIERLAVEAALDSLKVVGLAEYLRRLSQPSPLFTHKPTKTESEAEVQTKQDFVTHSVKG